MGKIVDKIYEMSDKLIFGFDRHILELKMSQNLIRGKFAFAIESMKWTEDRIKSLDNVSINSARVITPKDDYLWVESDAIKVVFELTCTEPIAEETIRKKIACNKYDTNIEKDGGSVIVTTTLLRS